MTERDDSTGRVLGVIGTLVWDRIYDRDGRSAPVEEWGGITYALQAVSAALPEGWRILPILKVGRDLAEEGRRFLLEIPRVDADAVVVVPEANNRVELRYRDGGRRTEQLEGGVPPWSWPELSPLTELCDALYVNFISGFEMELGTARALRVGYGGPMYADLHSLFLEMAPSGMRIPRPLEAWASWLRCFDAVQMNEDEFDMLGDTGDPWRLAADAMGPDLELLMVTLGDRGAAYVVSESFAPDPMTWRAGETLARTPRSRSGRVSVEYPVSTGDPTGCGDVWGGAVFARLLAGDGLDEAMSEANRLAALNAAHRGARGLFRHLTGRLSYIEERS
ncbi:MAG: carbohydrate kinase family protein [Gemmatimonadota bacterium]|nr:carbohydrate kinase family protein [Gemmatimonadota bacterium]